MIRAQGARAGGMLHVRCAPAAPVPRPGAPPPGRPAYVSSVATLNV